EPTAVILHLSPEGRVGFIEWHDACMAEMQQPGVPSALRGPWAKLPSQLARIALILHVVEHGPQGVVSIRTIRAAADLIEYFKAHVRRVYGALTHQRGNRPMMILAALKQRQRMTQNEIRDLFNRNVPADILRNDLAELEAAGLIRRERDQDHPGRPTTWWVLAMSDFSRFRVFAPADKGGEDPWKVALPCSP